MPKETISTGLQTKVDVVWRRGRYAQVGVTLTDAHSPDLQIRAANGEMFDSLWGDLSVEDINRMQLVLRRVKRQLLLPPTPDD